MTMSAIIMLMAAIIMVMTPMIMTMISLFNYEYIDKYICDDLKFNSMIQL